MIRPVAAVVAFALLGGCGYKLGEIRPTPMRSVRTLAVPTFKNRTYEPRVEVLLADTLIKTLQEDGTYTIVSDDTADAILHCTVTKIERRSIRSVQNNVLATAEFGLHLDIAYEVADRVTGSLLKKGKVRGDTSFFSSSDIQTTERQAIPVAARDAAIELTTEIAEGW
ncbi:MAG TPA: LptE family protein [Terrimicrobiaceae bacterium]|jgi:outer membrane lipopolysaccharide assembly protein LptE/RlpB|nr:LptE family protein [Terrimicrobiaceae bacterium]